MAHAHLGYFRAGKDTAGEGCMAVLMMFVRVFCVSLWVRGWKG